MRADNRPGARSDRFKECCNLIARPVDVARLRPDTNPAAILAKFYVTTMAPIECAIESVSSNFESCTTIKRVVTLCRHLANNTNMDKALRRS